MIKPIELTEKHREMLLKMCNKLFPENKTWRFTNPVWSPMLEFANEGDIVEQIHWFEFVVTKLFMKVFPDKKTMFCGTLCNSSESILHYEVLIHWLAGYPETYMKGLKNYHPIEYLYKHFIKIKNNDNSKKEK